MPVSARVTEVLVITDDPSGMRARTAWRAASRSSTTSTLNPCSSRAVTADAITCSSGSVVNRSGVAIVLIGWSSLGDSATLGGITGLYPGYIPTGWAEPGRAGNVGECLAPPRQDWPASLPT